MVICKLRRLSDKYKGKVLKLKGLRYTVKYNNPISCTLYTDRKASKKQAEELVGDTILVS